MEPHPITTPFGRRPVSLGQIATQLQTEQRRDAAAQSGSNQPAAVNKWQLFRNLTEIRERIGVSDRALGVLNALLSFQQETALTLPKAPPQEDGAPERKPSCDLVVFPSNKALSLRAHGMPPATLRRHLAALVDAGLVIRRDSPNGKRYARKDVNGQERFSEVFGFDLTPLVTRAVEFETLVEVQRLERRSEAVVRERISLLRRDIAKLIACGLDENLPGAWDQYRQRFMDLLTPLRRLRNPQDFQHTLNTLMELHGEISRVFQTIAISYNLSANESQNERHQSNSKTDSHSNFEPSSEKKGSEVSTLHDDGEHGNALIEVKSSVGEIDQDQKRETEQVYPVGMVLEACPDVQDYALNGPVRTWPALLETVSIIRPMLGISPDAWREAQDILGAMDAAIVVASILQRSEYSSEAQVKSDAETGAKKVVVNGSPAIRSAGGYLRALTDKARAGEFALGPILMALIGQRSKSARAGKMKQQP